MSDTLIPFSESANGKTNSFCLQCKKVEQAMNYAACLRRIEVVKSGLDVPKDWAVCDQAVRFGACIANDMRQEEELAGKSLYFRAREAIQAAADAARKWFMPGDAKATPAPARGRRKSTNALDALDDAGSLADALTAAASAPPARTVPIKPLPIAQVGETPLQMARRLKAEREAAAAA
jgi:hypothetical protein